MRKLRHAEALKLYHAELDRFGHAAAYEPKLESEVRKDASELEWWLDKLDEGPGETARAKALFRAYLRIANGDTEIKVGDRLPAQGLRIEPRGRWYMDKYVIAKAYQKGLLTFEVKPEGMFEPAFVLSTAGMEWTSS